MCNIAAQNLACTINRNTNKNIFDLTLFEWLYDSSQIWISILIKRYVRERESDRKIELQPISCKDHCFFTQPVKYKYPEAFLPNQLGVKMFL